jgi:hypothetical protein
MLICAVSAAFPANSDTTIQLRHLSQREAAAEGNASSARRLSDEAIVKIAPSMVHEYSDVVDGAVRGDGQLRVRKWSGPIRVAIHDWHQNDLAVSSAFYQYLRQDIEKLASVAHVPVAVTTAKSKDRNVSIIVSRYGEPQHPENITFPVRDESNIRRDTQSFDGFFGRGLEKVNSANPSRPIGPRAIESPWPPLVYCAWRASDRWDIFVAVIHIMIVDDSGQQAEGLRGMLERCWSEVLGLSFTALEDARSIRNRLEYLLKILYRNEILPGMRLENLTEFIRTHAPGLPW